MPPKGWFEHAATRPFTGNGSSAERASSRVVPAIGPLNVLSELDRLVHPGHVIPHLLA